ncbi:kit ligand [Pelodytes ibericus]
MADSENGCRYDLAVVIVSKQQPKTWIITFIYLQLHSICFGSPCGNPVTDAVNDIEKLVGNLPNDYNMALRYVPKNEDLPKHCWLYVMLNEVSFRIDVLSSKFSSLSQNYLILNNLSLILQGIRDCVQFSEQMDFVEEYSLHEGNFPPQKFFSFITKTIEVFKEINNTDYDRTCVLPTSNYWNHGTNKDLPYVPSTRKNSSRIISPDEARPSSNTSLHWTSIASTALSCLFVGFLFGALCWWKVKHRSAQTEEIGQTNSAEPRDVNESNTTLYVGSAKVKSSFPYSSSIPTLDSRSRTQFLEALDRKQMQHFSPLVFFFKLAREEVIAKTLLFS